jgi:hypothetical protein
MTLALTNEAVRRDNHVEKNLFNSLSAMDGRDRPLKKLAL